MCSVLLSECGYGPIFSSKFFFVFFVFLMCECMEIDEVVTMKKNVFNVFIKTTRRTFGAPRLKISICV